MPKKNHHLKIRYKELRERVKENGIKSLTDEEREFFKNFHTLILE